LPAVCHNPSPAPPFHVMVLAANAADGHSANTTKKHSAMETIRLILLTSVCF
jgi:hypothetical protein